MFHFRNCKFLVAPALALVSLASAAPVPAQEESLDAESFLGDVPVFLTVTRLPQAMSETPASVTIIDRQMIEASGAVEVADLLRLVPGFVVGHYTGPDGQRTVVSYYGASDQYARRLQVLIDGMSVYMPATGGVEWNDLPLAIDDIERIEVVRGPNGAAYGANAFMGVINIITRHPQDTSSMARATAGSVSWREGMFRISGGDQFQYRLTGDYRSSHGYANEHLNPVSHSQVNDDSATRMLSWRGDYRSSVNDYWTFQLGYLNGPRQSGDAADPFNPVRWQQVTSDDQQIRWRRLFDSDTEVEVLAYRNYHRKSDSYATAPLSAILGVPPAAVPIVLATLGYPAEPDQQLQVDTGLVSERRDAQISWRFRPLQDWRVVTGAEYRIDGTRGDSYFGGNKSFTNESTRLFFNGEWKPNELWTANIGDLYEQSPVLGSAHSPRLSLSRKLPGPHFVRATASRAYRIPSFAEEEINFTYYFNDGVPLHTLYDSPGDVKPEQIDSYELALGADAGSYSYEVKHFRNEITSLVTTALVDPSAAFQSWRVMNGGALNIEGTELQLSFKPQPDLLLTLGASVANASGWRIAELPSTREDISDSVPTSTFSMLFSKRMESGDQVGITFSAVSQVRHFAGDLTEGVHTADVNFVHPFHWAGHASKVRVLLRDIVGSYYDFEDETDRSFEGFFTLETAI